MEKVGQRRQGDGERGLESQGDKIGNCVELGKSVEMKVLLHFFMEGEGQWVGPKELGG